MAPSTDDFFHSRLNQMIDLRHPLAVLASRMHWQKIEASLTHRFARSAKADKQIEDIDLLGAAGLVLSAGGVSKAGLPRMPLRFMVSLLYLKHAFNESDEALVERWGETPTWQYFSGLADVEHRWPCDPKLLVKFRKLIGEEGVEELLARAIEAAVSLKFISKHELSEIIVDSTVPEKAITHPTDSKLLQAARAKLVESAQEEGIALKQTYAKESQVLGYRVGRYAHARQYRRMRKVIQRQRTIVGRLQREVGRKMSALALAEQETLGKTLSQAKRLVSQTASRKNQGKQPKLYSWHAPEVECISKGKSRNPYEFGVKVGIATTLKGNLIVGARTFPGNPYDEHTLHQQVEQASILMQATGVRPQTVYVDLGYRGVDQANPDIAIKHRGRFKSFTDEKRKNLKRRQDIEPTIGHLQAYHRMNRCHLLGAQDDSLHAVLYAAGYNIRWLLRTIAKKGVPFLQTLLLRLLEQSSLTAMGRRAPKKMGKFGADVRGQRRLDASVSLALG